MNRIFLLAIILVSNVLFSQINVMEIKKNVLENPQKFYYDYLEVFKNDPSKLSQEERKYLY